MHRRSFFLGALALAGAPPALAEPQDRLAQYRARLGEAVETIGGGRFLRPMGREMAKAHNKIRADHGLGPLAFDPGLAAAAEAHAADLTGRRYFAHASPEGFQVEVRAGLVARRFVGLAGENLIETSGGLRPPEVSALMDEWMDSPGHRDNILDPDYSAVGLGVVQSPRRTVAVAVFGDRRGEARETVPLDCPDQAWLTAALEADPLFRSYNLSPATDRSLLLGPFGAGLRAAAPAGSYLLRPRLREGAGVIIVYGPVVTIEA